MEQTARWMQNAHPGLVEQKFIFEDSKSFLKNANYLKALIPKLLFKLALRHLGGASGIRQMVILLEFTQGIACLSA